MSSPEEGEIEDDISPKDTLMAVSTNCYSMLGQKATTGTSSGADRPTIAPNYRSTARPVNSSSESGSEGEEDTPLWRHKKEKYFRQNKNSTHCPSPTLPEFTPTSKNGTGSASTSKNRNIWGSVLQEQDLTHALVRDISVNRSKDVNYHERTVESYDFTNKYKDKRQQNDADEPEDESSETHDPFRKVLKSSVQSVQGREVIGYEDTLYGGDKRTKSRKRKAGSDRNESKTGVHERLGPKKVATVKVGNWVVSEDMELEELASKISEYIHEPKVELIERVAQHMGKDVAIRILNQTRDVEEGGGMLTQDGSRRRTPGGVYLQLLKQQPEYDKEMYKQIFVEDNDFKIQQRQQRKQRRRTRRKARAKQEPRNGSSSRSRSASGERDDSDLNDEDMEDDHGKKSTKSESPGEKMDCGEKSEKERKYRKSRSHSQSEERAESKNSQNPDCENLKPKSKRSKSFSTYSDQDEDDDDPEDSSFNSAGSRKSGEFDFQKELEVAKTLITKGKSQSSKESAEMEEAEQDVTDDINDELDEANVVDIPLDD